LYQFGTYLNKKILLVQSGIGGKNIRRALRSLPLKYDISLAINIGCTGSLVPSIRIAHLNIPCQIKLYKEQAMNFIPQKEVLAFAHSTANEFNRATSHFFPALTVKKVFDREEKMALHRNAPELGCVDLESYYFAQFFSKLQIPYLIIRAVSDTCELSLPPVSYLSPSYWKRWAHMPELSKQLPSILRFHLAVIQACWINQRFINFLLCRIRNLDI